MTGPVAPPPQEIDVTEDLVRELLRSQHPDLADEELSVVANGWDNVIVRLGADLLVRLPRRAQGAQLVLNEQRWLPELAPSLPLPVPTPVRLGLPSDTFPWHWTITRWLPGETALARPPVDTSLAAATLGAFIAALHQQAPADAPPNPYRGIPLAGRDEMTRRWIDQLAGQLDAPRVQRVWSHHVDLPRWAGPAMWLHGDLHPYNVLVTEGAVSAVIDFGDITAGDPATDLGIAWMLLPPSDRTVLRDAIGVDDQTWGRGRGWALAVGIACWANSASVPAFEQLGRATIAAVIDDPDLDLGLDLGEG